MSLHQLRVALGASVLLIGCGSAPRDPARARPPERRDPIPRTQGASCRAAADRMAVVIGEHAPDQPDGDIHERALFELRCETDHWSDETRSCLATITSDAEADGCLHTLTQTQQQALADDRARLRAERDGHAPE
ncbi:MAG: hypothetical protein E6J90_13395 [Deltaproteobacteria bacterium]|nr:MAG: hypothetical protein E6J90_13395 [Deltaproteobacteria bacterium]